MNLTIIGTGFVGVVSAAVFASQGNTVFGLDIDPKRIEMLKRGKVPFYEPNLEELLVKVQEQGNLTFTTSYEDAIPHSDVILIAVGTPSAEDGQADLRFVFSACDSLAPHLKENTIIAIKSTVPPGTCPKVEAYIKTKTKVAFTVASLPEFLREGSAVRDTMHPDRIVIGSHDEEALERLQELHAPFGSTIVVMTPESAQMCKYAANAYLATRITFINQIANLCEVNGANILEVIKGLGMDKRIGSHYWYPGLGYGGSCFPKDVKELAAYAKAIGQSGNLMVTIDDLNTRRIVQLFDAFDGKVGGFAGKRVAVMGLAFKPNTDDMREAPSASIVPYLLRKNAVVRAYDPMASESARQYFLREGIFEADNFRIETTAVNALTDADIVIMVVEWKEFIEMDVASIAMKTAEKAVFIDCRDQFDKQTVQEAGLTYIGIGM